MLSLKQGDTSDRCTKRSSCDSWGRVYSRTCDTDARKPALLHKRHQLGGKLLVGRGREFGVGGG